MLPLSWRQECQRSHVCALGWVGSVYGSELMPVKQLTGENHRRQKAWARVPHASFLPTKISRGFSEMTFLVV